MKARALLALVPVLALPVSHDAHAEDAKPPRPPATSRLRVAVEGGYGISEAVAYRLRSQGAHLALTAGPETGRLYVPFSLELDLGRTPGGLGMTEAKGALGVQGVLGPVRLGVGADAGFLFVGRASGGVIPAYALDLHAVVSVDVVPLGDHRAMYLALRPSAGVRWGEDFFAWGHGTTTWRGTALAGVRF